MATLGQFFPMCSSMILWSSAAFAFAVSKADFLRTFFEKTMSFFRFLITVNVFLPPVFPVHAVVPEGE